MPAPFDQIDFKPNIFSHSFRPDQEKPILTLETQLQQAANLEDFLDIYTKSIPEMDVEDDIKARVINAWIRLRDDLSVSATSESAKAMVKRVANEHFPQHIDTILRLTFPAEKENINPFAEISNLGLLMDAIDSKDQKYFSNADSLKIITAINRCLNDNFLNSIEFLNNESLSQKIKETLRDIPGTDSLRVQINTLLLEHLQEKIPKLKESAIRTYSSEETFVSQFVRQKLKDLLTRIDVVSDFKKIQDKDTPFSEALPLLRKLKETGQENATIRFTEDGNTTEHTVNFILTIIDKIQKLLDEDVGKNTPIVNKNIQDLTRKSDLRKRVSQYFDIPFDN